MLNNYTVLFYLPSQYQEIFRVYLRRSKYKRFEKGYQKVASIYNLIKKILNKIS